LETDQETPDRVVTDIQRAMADKDFRENAPRWDEIRSLHVSESEVERVLLDKMAHWEVESLLDIGTGTGRMLELLGPRVSRALGIDRSHEMLSIARANLERAGLRHCQVRHGDMYQLPLPSESFDAVTIHQVLHFADLPAAALQEAARVLRPGGILIVIDFAPHDREDLRENHAHRRLGFTEDEVKSWLRGGALEPEEVVHLPGDPVPVSSWSAPRPAANARSKRLRRSDHDAA
ncbi:MAG: class I SAM-dependent methyltransferase, partial [Nitrospinota bacterium]